METTKPISQAMEDYLRAIYKLQEQGERVSTSAVAERMGVAAASVTKMLKRLAALELVEHEPYQGVALTELGRKTALGVVRQHRLIELFLTKVLKVPWDRVHEEAHRLEHVLSDYLEERMSEILDDPRFDPHGQPIPTKDGVIFRQEVMRLSDAAVGQSGIVAEIEDDDAALLRYVAKRGLFPQTKIKILERDPYGGGVKIAIDEDIIAVGPQAAQQIWLFAENLLPNDENAPS